MKTLPVVRKACLTKTTLSSRGHRTDTPVNKEPTWSRIVRPPFLAIGFALNVIYAGLFGWWLDKRIAKKRDESLANEVRQNLPFLFTDKCGRIVSSEDSLLQRRFGSAIVTVATQDLWIRFVCVRGEFSLKVASAQAPYIWEDLSDALENAEMRRGVTLNDVVKRRPSRAYSSFADVAQLLRAQWALLRLYYANC